MTVWVWIGVALLGGGGAVARFLLDAVVTRRVSAPVPLGTLAINVSGAFVLGLVSGLGLTGPPLVLAGTAAIGAYTTFSTWMLETHRLAEDAQRRAAAVNIVLSLAAGLGATELGRLIGG